MSKMAHPTTGSAPHDDVQNLHLDTLITHEFEQSVTEPTRDEHILFNQPIIAVGVQVGMPFTNSDTPE